MSLCLCGIFSGSLVHAAGTRLAEAERLARQAMEQCAGGTADVPAAEARARRALGATAEFDPTHFVAAGRKGEMVEDAFLDARRGYRRHRALLYEAVGACRARRGDPRVASRYLRRAALLDPTPERWMALGRSLVAAARAQEALAALRAASPAAVVPPGRERSELSQEWARLMEQAADGARLPSAQAEIDRWRLLALKADNVEHVLGPVRLAAEARLSTGRPFAWTNEPVVVYVASSSCRECSAHLQGIAGAVGARGHRAPDAGAASARVLVLPQEPDQDQALRQVLALYGYEWPLLLGRGHPAALGAAAGTVMVVARGGWSGARVRPPFADALPAALAVLSRTDVNETPPRPNWNQRPPEHFTAEPPPLLAGGLAPGEDEPAPAAFTAAVDALRGGRGLEALRFLESLAASDDGWLLPPEARFNRAVALAALGQREAARRLLLRIGDSRFQEAVDRVLEALPGR